MVAWLAPQTVRDAHAPSQTHALADPDHLPPAQSELHGRLTLQQLPFQHIADHSKSVEFSHAQGQNLVRFHTLHATGTAARGDISILRKGDTLIFFQHWTHIRCWTH